MARIRCPRPKSKTLKLRPTQVSGALCQSNPRTFFSKCARHQKAIPDACTWKLKYIFSRLCHLSTLKTIILTLKNFFNIRTTYIYPSIFQNQFLIKQFKVSNIDVQFYNQVLQESLELLTMSPPHPGLLSQGSM